MEGEGDPQLTLGLYGITSAFKHPKTMCYQQPEIGYKNRILLYMESGKSLKKGRIHQIQRIEKSN